jgi:hypothetical protein
MGDGLKQQWGVDDPSKPASDQQSQEFQAAFQQQIGAINSDLQYTSANAEAGKHDPLAGRRDALLTAFQSALGQIDPKNPAKAKATIDKVLADSKALGGEVSKLRKDTEKAATDWQSRQANFDTAVQQVEELEAWGDPKAAPLRGLVDGVRTQVNQRHYSGANPIVDQLLPKLKPIYEDYQHQKEAKDQYDTAMVGLQPRLSDASVSRYAKLAADQLKMVDVQNKMEAAVKGKNYVQALALVGDLSDKVDAYTTAAQQVEQQKQDYESALSALQPKLTNASQSRYPTLDPMEQDMVTVQNKMEEAAKNQDYDQALKLEQDLSDKVDAYTAALNDLDQKKKQYEDGLAALQPKLTESSQCRYPSLDPMQKDMITVQDQMEAAAKKTDYAQALTSLNDLSAKVDAYLAAKKDLEQKYQDSLQAVQKAIDEMKSHAQKANFTTEIAALETKLKEAKTKGDGNDLEGAMKLLQTLQSNCSQTRTTMDMVTKGLNKARAAQVADVTQSLVDSGVDKDKALEIGQVTKIGGSGDVGDAKLVAKQLAVLPTDVIKTMRANGTNVVACRDSITDYRADLKGQHPDGWDPGAKWDTVPGIYLPDKNEVVVGVRGHGTPGGPAVPSTGDGHGAFDLAAHESMHGYDLGKQGATPKHNEKAFLDARKKDLAKLGKYFTQPGDNGPRETYAESAARYYGGDPTLKTDWPNLYAYWDSQPK